MRRSKKAGRPKTKYRGVPFPEDWKDLSIEM